MVVRLAILFLIALGVFVALRLLLGRKQVTVRQFGLIYAFALAGLALLFLGLTGRLHWLFSLLGILLPFLLRIIPFFLQLLNLKQAVNWFQNVTSGSAPSSGQKSELNTRFFAMRLDHDSGDMDGRVLEGRFEGRTLSDLDLESLLSLLREVAVDADSESVLRAYLDRVHPDWTESASGGDRDSGPEIREGNLSVSDAYDILGLAPGCDKQAVRDAHRRLIRQHHPDHGGSNYLAARINEAKDVLLRHLRGN